MNGTKSRKGRQQLIRAIVKRELISYFSSPTGYVFITFFVFLSAMAAFWQEAFFANNLANLDQLNRLIPYLLIFLMPAVTMGIWAEERKNGTDELLLTLPAADFDIVGGKYLAALAIYSVALLFSFSHVVVLSWLGSPDLGLMFSTYFGYWLMGAPLLALGMLASLLTANLTIAFILGGLFCAVPVFIDRASVVLTGPLSHLLASLSLREQFRDLSSGVVTLSSLFYFVSFAGAVLYVNVNLLGRRHWPTVKGAPRLGLHYGIRGVSLVVSAVALTLLTGRVGGRLDLTAERVHSLSPDTRKLIAALDSKRPVFIQAYLSPDVPRSYLQTRNNIVAILREFEALGKGRIFVRVVDARKYTPEAREAQERFNIRARSVPASLETPGSADEIYLGIAFSCSAEEFVIPFFDPGLPVEYELMRSIRVVSRAERKTVGVLRTAARLLGGFDFQSRTPTPEWSIVAELRKQYEVVEVNPGADYPRDLDALIAVQPTTLQQDHVDRLAKYLEEGRTALLMVDPVPTFSPELSPQQLPQNPFLPSPPQQPPADISRVTEALGVEWPTDRIAWDKYNPHPRFRTFPPEVVFVGASNRTAVFNRREPVSSDLQEVVMIYPGLLKPAEAGATEFIPLVQTGTDSGEIEWHKIVQPSIFGPDLATNLPHEPDGKNRVLAARIRGNSKGKSVNAIVIADADMMGEQFFQMRRAGIEGLQFDNVTFLLNAVDQLAGDESFIALRKRRPRYRTLEAVEARTRVHEEQRVRETLEAEKTAEQRVKEAQERLDRAIENLRQRTDRDEQTRRIMIANQQQVENRRLEVARANIEDEKQRTIERSRAEMESSVRRIQNAIKVLAVALPPIPALALFLIVSVRRLRREKIGVSSDRLVHR